MASNNPYAALDSSRNRPSLTGPSTAVNDPPYNGSGSQMPKKKKHRSGRKHRRKRRPSILAPSEDIPEHSSAGPSNSFYMSGNHNNLSGTSIDSDAALMDHRGQKWAQRPRRPSTQVLGSSFQIPRCDREIRSRGVQGRQNDQGEHEEDNDEVTENAPLLSNSTRFDFGTGSPRGYDYNEGRLKLERHSELRRRGSSRSSRRPLMTPSAEYDVNNPPSMPPTPKMGPSDGVDINFEGLMLREDITRTMSHPDSVMGADESSLRLDSPAFERRHTVSMGAEEDVCFPQEGMSEMAEEDRWTQQRRNRRRRSKWPDFSTLDEWSRFEMSRSEGKGTKKITEPPLIEGRLRPTRNKGWYRVEEEAPYRFTYFNEDFESTIHSQTISGLTQHGSSWKELFLPEPPVLSDSSDDEEDNHQPAPPPVSLQLSSSLKNGDGNSKLPTRQPSLANMQALSERNTEDTLSPRPLASGSAIPSRQHSPGDRDGAKTPVDPKSPAIRGSKPVRYGTRPVWWLDVLSPTEAEMKVICKTFGIHALTSEDIRLEEQREKVELFPNYYFVNYRSFDQVLALSETETDFEPLNMYVVVFHDGVISFHYNQMPHPANVRRRIRNIRDSIGITADWINYAIIDDITDAFAPMIQSIEDEVDDIDDAILRLHSSADPAAKTINGKVGEKDGDAASVAAQTALETSSDMLRRVGTCRKKVMSLLRLLGYKADVIKGFAKRCNDQWQVAPRSDIGLYLGDVQDHLVTMTANLSHYEMILARAHGNYLAQIQIRMTERSEETADKLNLLTVLGTIVLPMNIVTGLWGMNVWVPGQEKEHDLKWFFAITGGLLLFGVACYIFARKVLKLI